jgi:hypothetical protein
MPTAPPVITNRNPWTLIQILAVIIVDVRVGLN